MTRIYTTTFAATGDKETLAATDPGTGKVSLPSGWTPDYEKLDTDPSYRPVGRKEMNGVINEVTAAVGELQQYAFDFNINVKLRFVSSINLAKSVGVPEISILKNEDEIDKYFLC